LRSIFESAKITTLSIHQDANLPKGCSLSAIFFQAAGLFSFCLFAKVHSSSLLPFLNIRKKSVLLPIEKINDI